jgi:CBS domain-containing protein
MLVKEIMTPNPLTVSPQTAIRDLAQIMSEKGITAVPVVANGELVGIVTEIDLISRHAPVRAPQYISLLWGAIPLRLNDYARYKEHVRHILAVNVEQIMTRKVTTIGPDESIARMAEIMTKPGYRSLPVVQNGQLIGIVTRTDLVKLIEQMETGDGE